jgi:hypothetical protein
MRKGLLAYLTPLLAIGLAGIAGFISILGMSKLFAGQAEIVMVVMGIIESGKVVGASILHNHWKDKGYKVIKWILLLMVSISMIITSWGVYGFFTDAYQQTAGQLGIDKKEVQLIENKKEIFNKNIETTNSQIEFKNNQAQKLIDLRTQQEVRLDSLLANNHWTNAKVTQNQIEDANNDLKVIQSDIDTMWMEINGFQDSIGRLDIQILEMESNSEASAELGPLIYIAKVFDTDMDTVVNYVMLFIMFVFDPFAMILIIVTNKMWKRRRRGDQGNDQDDDQAPTKPKSGPLVEGKTKSNVKRGNLPGHRNAPPPPPIHGPDSEYNQIMAEQWKKHKLKTMVEPVEEKEDPSLIEEDTLEDVFLTPKKIEEIIEDKKPLGKYDLKFGPEYTKMMREMDEEMKVEENPLDKFILGKKGEVVIITKEIDESLVPNEKIKVDPDKVIETEPRMISEDFSDKPVEKTKGDEVTETWQNILRERKKKRGNNGISRLGDS